MSDALWSVVLAAGNGRRLAPVTGAVPKQFWAPRGGRTLLEHTIDRMAALMPPDRIVTIVDQSQRDYAARIGARTPLGRVVHQAGDRGTAAGVLRGLAEVAFDPDDLVVLTPSDHGIARSRIYLRGLREATWEVQSGRAEIVLLAAEPASPAGDYGWIVPAVDAPDVAGRVHRVQSFIEKPRPARAAALFAGGAVWNTMVTVARVSSLVDLYRAHLPVWADVFRQAQELPEDRRGAFLAARYAQLPCADFSDDVLTPARNLHVYVWPEAVGWTDLGTPDRLYAWLSADHGNAPAFAAARAPLAEGAMAASA